MERSQKFERAAQIVGTDAREKGNFFADFLSNSKNFVRRACDEVYGPDYASRAFMHHQGHFVFFSHNEPPQRAGRTFSRKRDASTNHRLFRSSIRLLSVYCAQCVRPLFKR